MVVSCCAFGCTERAVKGGPVTFHCFPKDVERRKIWGIKIRRENFKATKSSRLCSKHFSPDSFDREKFGGTWLKKTAVTTVFNFPKHVIERKITRKPLVRKTPEPEPVIEQATRKRKHYLGYFDDDDMNSPTKAVKKWYQVVDGSPGFTKEALEMLKCKAVEASQRNRQIVCCLIIDEMSIRRQTELDNGKLCRYIDYGTDLESPELPIANNALTFMVNAVNGNWKITIAYFLIDGLNDIKRTNLIKIALEYLHETEIKVVALTFDGLLCNFKVGNELGARIEAVNLKSTFQHPITGEDVCIFLDPCHCLKCVTPWDLKIQCSMLITKL
ncbi:hypothetical protein AVEN_158214-1 [Araneus ventricosus]|uniref:THAP-type domain-containing protein n=1 Tax=Araneus ventricosus TaxID=182803 RepID=A0A4Y2U6P9_ARAVE|nr:hypothetical protein AVEN_138431-1 [Araneus ventricosus]GBO07371.1 hypothetical protein AVEN_158214-1 [Araneus ventricosus]